MQGGGEDPQRSDGLWQSDGSPATSPTADDWERAAPSCPPPPRGLAGAGAWVSMGLAIAAYRRGDAPRRDYEQRYGVGAA
jgi:hypothetical protein